MNRFNIGSDSLSPIRRQAIIWTNDALLLIVSSAKSKYKTFHSRKCIWKHCLLNGGHFVLGEKSWRKQTIFCLLAHRLDNQRCILHVYSAICEPSLSLIRENNMKSVISLVSDYCQFQWVYLQSVSFFRHRGSVVPEYSRPTWTFTMATDTLTPCDTRSLTTLVINNCLMPLFTM